MNFLKFQAILCWTLESRSRLAFGKIKRSRYAKNEYESCRYE
jgi:hypothetical protein